jgi:hypothetical protein
MTETTPHLAPIVVLLFLGAVFTTGASFLILLYGAARRSRLYIRAGGAAALVVVACYALLLCGVSLASSEKVLPAGGWKYFCELDCHIGYSVSGVQTASVTGPELQQTSAQGQFVIVRLKVWFDEANHFSQQRRRATDPQRSPHTARGCERPRVRTISGRGSQACASSCRSGPYATTIASRPIFREGSCFRRAQRRFGTALANHRG